MENNYIVIGYGYNKKNGKPYSRLAKMIEYEKNGNVGGFIDLTAIQYSNDILDLGRIVTLEINII